MAADFVGLAAHCSLCQNQCVVFANGFSTSPIESQEFHSNSIPVTLWKITIFNGKIHYKWPFSIAMLNYQRVFIPTIGGFQSHPSPSVYMGSS